MTDTDAIPFYWVLEPATAETVAATLPALSGDLQREEVPPAVEPGSPIATTLEMAGLFFDQQQRPDPEATQVALSGTTSLDDLVQSVVEFAQVDGVGGGLVIDCSVTPVQLTEVREVSERTLVLMDRAGARQLQVSQEAIVAALREALADDAPGAQQA